MHSSAGRSSSLGLPLTSHVGGFGEEDTPDVEAGDSGENADASRKHIVVDDSRQAYEIKKILRKERDLLNKDTKRVTFSEVVLVTPYRESSGNPPAPDTVEDDDDVDSSVIKARRKYRSLIRSSYTVEQLTTYLCLSSVTVVFSSADSCFVAGGCNAFTSLGIAVGALSLLVGTGLLFIFYKRPLGLDLQVFTVFVNIISVVWLIASLALSLPSSAPFFVANVGFFASWGCFILGVSLSSLGEETREWRFVMRLVDISTDKSRSRYLFLATWFGLLCTISAVASCASRTCTSGLSIFTVIWSIACFFMHVFLLVRWKEVLSSTYKIASLVTCCASATGASIATILGPFSSGNAALGFFSAWFMTFWSFSSFFSHDPRGN